MPATLSIVLSVFLIYFDGIGPESLKIRSGSNRPSMEISSREFLEERAYNVSKHCVDRVAQSPNHTTRISRKSILSGRLRSILANQFLLPTGYSPAEREKTGREWNVGWTSETNIYIRTHTHTHAINVSVCVCVWSKKGGRGHNIRAFFEFLIILVICASPLDPVFRGYKQQGARAPFEKGNRTTRWREL